MLYKIGEHEQYASFRKIKPQIPWMQRSVELLERKMILHQNVTGADDDELSVKLLVHKKIILNIIKIFIFQWLPARVLLKLCT